MQIFYYFKYYLLNRRMRRLLLSIPFRKKLALLRALGNLTLGRRARGKPVYYQIETTTHCNLKCPHCPRFHVPIDLVHMPLDVFKKIIDDNPSLTLILLQGLGEPLMNPEFFAMIEHASQKGIVVMTCSNGTFLTEKNIERLIRSGLRYLAISIDDVGPELEAIRPPTRFEKLHENLIRLREMKRESDLILSFWITIQAANRKTFTRVIDLAHDIEVDQANFQHMGYGFDPELKEQCLLQNTDQVQVINAEIEERCRKYGIRYNILSSMQNKVRKKCIWPWVAAYIDVHGNFLPCCSVFDPALAMGNLKQQSVHDFWNGESYRNLRAALTSEKVPSFCVNCHNL